MRHSNISMLVSVTRARSLLNISAGPIDAMIGAGVGDTESGTSDGGSKDTGERSSEGNRPLI